MGLYGAWHGDVLDSYDVNYMHRIDNGILFSRSTIVFVQRISARAGGSAAIRLRNPAESKRQH